MAKEAKITRTMKTTEVTAVAVDLTTRECVTFTYTLPRTYKDNKEILKVVKATFDTPVLNHIDIESVKVIEKRYGLAESKFLEVAEEIPMKSVEE